MLNIIIYNYALSFPEYEIVAHEKLKSGHWLLSVHQTPTRHTWCWVYHSIDLVTTQFIVKQNSAEG